MYTLYRKSAEESKYEALRAQRISKRSLWTRCCCLQSPPPGLPFTFRSNVCIKYSDAYITVVKSTAMILSFTNYCFNTVLLTQYLLFNTHANKRKRSIVMKTLSFNCADRQLIEVIRQQCTVLYSTIVIPIITNLLITFIFLYCNYY